MKKLDKIATINKRKKLLIRFLKEHKCYKQFAINFSNQKDIWQDCNSSIEKLIEKMIEEPGRSEIDYGFNWGSTDEGALYWRVINSKWKDIIFKT